MQNDLYNTEKLRNNVNAPHRGLMSNLMSVLTTDYSETINNFVKVHLS